MMQGLQLTPELIASYQQLAREAIANCPAYPADRFRGRGIVTCAGGAKYFPCVWVTLNELRRLGCTLPVEVWHLGRHEMTPEMEGLLAPLGECEFFVTDAGSSSSSSSGSIG